MELKEFFNNLNEQIEKDPKKVAKRIFIKLLDPEIVSGGLKNFEDNMIEEMGVPDGDIPFRNEVLKAAKEYIRKVKAFVRTI